MQGLLVKCFGCGKVLHETTDQYNPNITPNGSMVRLLNPWKKWGWSTFDDQGQGISTTKPALMTCPSCATPLVKNKKLTIVRNIKSRAAINQAELDALELKDDWIEDRPVQAQAQVQVQIQDDESVCNICGKVCLSARGVMIHKRKVHKTHKEVIRACMARKAQP